MKQIIAGLIAAGILSIVVLLLFMGEDDTTPEDILEEHDIEGEAVETQVEHFEKTPLDFDEVVASVDGERLRIETAADFMKIPLEDKFYLSFAPYIDDTHPCTIHNLTTCRAELDEETFDVRITNENGVIFEDTLTTHENGFKGVWLERDIEATLHIIHGDLEVSREIETYQDSPTCITDIQLT